MLIRRAGTHDFEALQALENRVFGRESWSAADYLRFECWVAMDGTTLAGCMVYHVIVEAEAELLSIAVAPEYRRQGIAKLLLAQLPDLPVFLEVRVSNEGAIQLYESQGFRITGRRKGYYKLPPEDAFVMVRKRPVVPNAP